MLVIGKNSYADALDVIQRINVWLGEGENWGPVYANNCDATGVCTNPTAFGVEWKSWMDTITVNGVPVLTPQEVAQTHPDIELWAVNRGTWNGCTWWEYAPPPPPEE